MIKSNQHPKQFGFPVAVVGGKGYLGRHLIQLLETLNCKYWVVGRQVLNSPQVHRFEYRSSIPDLAKAISGAQTVIHLASLTTPATGEKNNFLDIDNIKFTLDLIDACKKERVKHLIFASSGGTIYGNLKKSATESQCPSPSSSYAIAKLACESYLRIAAEKKHLKVTVLRISNPYGGIQVVKGEQGIVSYIVENIQKKNEIILLGETVRDYIYIDDVSEAFFSAIKTPPLNLQTFNISTGKGTNLKDLATIVFKLMGEEPQFRITEPRCFDLPYNVLNNSKAKKVLGWSPQISLETGLKRYIARFKELYG